MTGARTPAADPSSGPPSASPARVAVVGAGAVGLALATALHAAGTEVHLVVRPSTGAGDAGRPGAGERSPGRVAELARGYRRIGLFGEVAVPPEAAHVSDSLDALARVDPDFTLVCTKTTATAVLAPALGRALAAAPRATPVVVCHNGWGSAERFAEHLGTARVFSGRVITGFRLVSPACVDVTVHAAPIHLGHVDGRDPAVLAPLAAAIDRGGLPCAVAADVRADLLAKLLYNGLLNPLGALVDAPYGELGARPTTRALMVALAHETFAVFEAAGLATHWPDAESYLETFFRDLLPPTADHESSMLQDLRAGRATEIDAISGAVRALGEAHGVDTPCHAALVTLVHAAEARRRR